MLQLHGVVAILISCRSGQIQLRDRQMSPYYSKPGRFWIYLLNNSGQIQLRDRQMSNNYSVPCMFANILPFQIGIAHTQIEEPCLQYTRQVHIYSCHSEYLQLSDRQMSNNYSVPCRFTYILAIHDRSQTQIEEPYLQYTRQVCIYSYIS